METEPSFSVDSYKVHDENSGLRIDNLKSSEHSSNSAVYQFCIAMSKYPQKIKVINNNAAANYIEAEQLKKIIKAINYIQSEEKLDLTDLIDIIQEPVIMQREELRDELKQFYLSNYNLRQEKGELEDKLAEKNKHLDEQLQKRTGELLESGAALSRVSLDIANLTNQLKQKSRWFFQRHPLLTAGGAVLLSMPIYYGLFRLLQEYKIPCFG